MLFLSVHFVYDSFCISCVCIAQICISSGLSAMVYQLSGWITLKIDPKRGLALCVGHTGSWLAIKSVYSRCSKWLGGGKLWLWLYHCDAITRHENWTSTCRTQVGCRIQGSHKKVYSRYPSHETGRVVKFGGIIILHHKSSHFAHVGYRRQKQFLPLSLPLCLSSQGATTAVLIR